MLPTNNAAERDTRPSPIGRKATKGFQSTWDRDRYAGVRSVCNTARRHRKSDLLAIARSIAGTLRSILVKQ